MSKADIIEQLPKLDPVERRELLDRLYDLCEMDLFHGERPSEAEKALLDKELEEYEKDRSPGEPWAKVEAQLPKRRPK